MNGALLCRLASSVCFATHHLPAFSHSDSHGSNELQITHWPHCTFAATFCGQFWVNLNPIPDPGAYVYSYMDVCAISVQLLPDCRQALHVAGTTATLMAAATFVAFTAKSRNLKAKTMKKETWTKRLKDKEKKKKKLKPKVHNTDIKFFMHL